mmetsp:Transcript_360/g.1348  ORF Transcript_360/g.1348 Transcript_360/m.1348 type:complete len:880 (-) Transcript_360:56-2695(-)|eukprot:CAMPEP_0117439680 /NCGR_PEP_ID=MMETSP0759-20121206/2688_1 /TAXON_ID=63605 /ORGANISM="Percolomonas cosmopolitus, Strain WS" /LENGTH=879 /DNA_ID=CAMNT_0005231399 /DNA_START=286 /DNA_END=2925 /DNA_ORIENTATION=+
MPQLSRQQSKIFPHETRRDSRSSVALTASNASLKDMSTTPSDAFLVGYATSTQHASHRTNTSSNAKSGSGAGKLSDLARLQQRKYKSFFHKVLCYWPQQMILCSLRTPLACKLTFMVLVPLFSLMIISGFYVSQSAVSLHEQLKVEDAVQISEQLAVLSHTAAAERTISMLYLTTNGSEYFSDRLEAAKQTQEAIEQVLPNIVALKSEPDRASDIQVIQECQDQLENVAEIQEQVATLAISRGTAFQKYTDMIENCANVIDVAVRSLNVEALTNNILSYNIFLTYVEAVSRIQAKLIGALRTGSFDDVQEYADVLKLIGRRESVFDVFINVATPAQRQVLRDFISNDPLYVEFSSVLDSISVSIEGVNYSWEGFFRNSTRMLRRYDSLESQLIGSISEIEQRMTSESIGLLTGLLSAAVVIFIFTLCTIFVCSYCVWKPWAMVISKREDVMNLALDCADGIAKLDFNRKSVIDIVKTKDEDCTLLELAFKRIICNFQEFSQFLPQTLIAAVRAAAESPIAQVGDLKTSKVIDDPSQQKKDSKQIPSSTQSVGSSRVDSQAPMSASTYSFKNSSQKLLSTQPTNVSGNSSGDLAQIRMNYGLQYREVAVLVVDLQNMHGIINHCDSNGLCILHADIVNEFSRIVQRFNGVMHSFVGDKLIASWNSINSVIDREVLACRAALACSQALTNKLHPSWKAARLPPVECSFAVASGGTMAGNIGSEQQKGYVQFSPMMTRVWRMAKLVKSYGVDSAILIDDNTFQKIAMNFTARIIDVVQFKDVQHTSDFGLEKLYTLVSQKTMENDEWLYELEELEKQDEKGVGTLVEAFECVIREDFTGAAKVLEAYRTEAEEALEENIETVERLENYLEDTNDAQHLFDLV